MTDSQHLATLAPGLVQLSRDIRESLHEIEVYCDQPIAAPPLSGPEEELTAGQSGALTRRFDLKRCRFALQSLQGERGLGRAEPTEVDLDGWATYG